MLNKKVVVACTALLFFVAAAFGISTLAKNDTQKVSLSTTQEVETEVKNEIKEIESKEESKAVDENSEQAIESEEIEITEESKVTEEVKTKATENRPSLNTASRGSSLAPRSVAPVQKQVSEPAKPESKPVTQPEKPAASENGISGWSQEDYYWLAKMIHAESRGEPYEGQVAVGAVILRRVHHPDFPNTVYGVIFDKWEGKYYQFSPVADGSINLEPNETAYKAARDAMNGWDPSGGALYFYNPAKSTSKWIFSRPVIKTIGEHTFAK